MIGMILGNRYEILKEIGSGGMANVYLAHCRLLNRNVAVKILKSEFVNDKEFLERFNKEAQVAATISSPNIVNVYDVGHDGDIHYIVMEYVEGHTLKEYIDANGMLSWQETVEYAIQICSALDRAHKNGIIHRDIKPQNIILTNDGVLKVTDFGIARATSNETTNVGESTMGSVHYFSPEQARGGYTDAKSDIYSLGIVMYELITGILPFNGESPIAIAIKHMQEKPVSPKEFNVSIPLSVESIILKAMSKEQSLRYQSAEEMLADLNRVIQRPTEHIISDIPVNYGDTIKMEPVKPETRAKSEEKTETGESIVRRPVHSDGKKKPSTVKNPEEKGTKTAVALAIISSFAVIFLALCLVLWGVTGGFNSCSNKVLEVPNFMGMSYKDVVEKYDIENGGDFKIEIIEEKSGQKEGSVLSQDPEPGEQLKNSRTVTITVAVPFDSFMMPDIINKTEKQALKDLSDYEKDYDVSVNTVEQPTTEDNEVGKVLKTDPEPDTMVEKDSEITIYIGVKGVKMEKIDGIKLGDAKKWLEENGLVLADTDPILAPDSYVVIGVFVEDEDAIDGKKAVYENDIVAEGANIYLQLTKGAETGKVKNITVNLPTDREYTDVKVLQDGVKIYDQRHRTDDESISFNAQKPASSNKSIIKIYFDGELSMELEETWD